MPDLTAVNKELLAVCAGSDVPKLEKLLQTHNVPTDLPATKWQFDQSEPEASHLPARDQFFCAAIQANKPATLRFLFHYFQDSSLADGELIVALRVGDLKLVRTVCELDPSAPNSIYHHSWPLAIAASHRLRCPLVACPHLSCPHRTDPLVNAELVVLLLEMGADPNQGNEHMMQISNARSCIIEGLPASVIERFFDYGYRFCDPFIVGTAITEKRTDVLEVLFRRGKLQKGARWPPKAHLLEEAREVGDKEMLKAVKRIVPEDYDLDVWKARGVPKWRTCLCRPLLPLRREH